MLMFNLTLSDLISLEKVSLDDRTDGETSEGGGQYIQNPIIESRGFTQEVAMKSGQSLVLTGYERVENTSENPVSVRPTTHCSAVRPQPAKPEAFWSLS